MIDFGIITTDCVELVLSSMSRENLLTTRPRGVRSKNDTGALMTAENKRSCSRLDALISTFHIASASRQSETFEQWLKWSCEAGGSPDILLHGGTNRSRGLSPLAPSLQPLVSKLSKRSFSFVIPSHVHPHFLLIRQSTTDK